MHKRAKYQSCLFSVLLSVLVCWSAGAQQTNTPATSAMPFSSVHDNAGLGSASVVTAADNFVTGHLRVGTRITGYAFTHITGLHVDTHSGDESGTDSSFLGSINKLEADQNYMPVKIYADWFFTRDWGIELTWDKVIAASHSVHPDDTDVTDGKWDIKGPILSMIGRYCNSTRVTPYGGIGITYMFTDFDAAPYWSLRMSPAQWAANGYSDYPLIGSQTMDTDNALGFVAFGGCDVEVAHNFLLDVYARYMNVAVDTHYYINLPGGGYEDHGWYKIPLSNVALGLGVTYAF